MDVFLLALLTTLNALFAMSEMALSTSRRARLAALAETGDAGAVAALKLMESPTQFLSTVQIGITSIGMLSGIVGEAAFAEPLGVWMEGLGMGRGTASIVSTAVVVTCITFFTIIFGELVPKRIGQLYPEPVARWVSRPMRGLAKGAKPFVWLLAGATAATLKVLRIDANAARSVTEEEISASLEEGVDAGVIEQHEHQMVRNVFRLDERQIGSMMIPRAEIAWLDATDRAEQVLQILRAHGYSRYPVCRGGLHDVVGTVSAQNLLARTLAGEALDLSTGLEPPVFVPETLSGMELLAHMRGTDTPLAFVVDEYGEVQGVVAMRDVLEAIAGEFNSSDGDDAWAVQREDGSWLMDGLIPITELKDRLDLKELPEEDRGRYNTLAGMVMLLLGRLPRTADVVEWDAWRFEVVDLDGKRVDKVLVSRLADDGVNQ